MMTVNYIKFLYNVGFENCTILSDTRKTSFTIFLDIGVSAACDLL